MYRSSVSASSISIDLSWIPIASSDFAACRLWVRVRSEFHLQVSVRGCRIRQVVFRRSSAAVVDTLDVWDDDGGICDAFHQVALNDDDYDVVGVDRLISLSSQISPVNREDNAISRQIHRCKPIQEER
jgi:hypothetical protein